MKCFKNHNRLDLLVFETDDYVYHFILLWFFLAVVSDNRSQLFFRLDSCFFFAWHWFGGCFHNAFLYGLNRYSTRWNVPFLCWSILLGFCYKWFVAIVSERCKAYLTTNYNLLRRHVLNLLTSSWRYLSLFRFSFLFFSPITWEFITVTRLILNYGSIRCFKIRTLACEEAHHCATRKRH